MTKKKLNSSRSKETKETGTKCNVGLEQNCHKEYNWANMDITEQGLLLR